MKYRDFSLFAGIRLLAVVLLLVLSACDNAPLKSTPIGDHAALERLAEAYRSVAQEYPVQPASMRPAGKKKFIEGVFTAAGYSFSATLKAFASQGVDATNQDHSDLVELLMLPHKGLADLDMEALYSTEELAAIHSIQSSLK